MSAYRVVVPSVLAVIATLPGIVAALTHAELSPPAMAALVGTAIIGAAFLTSGGL